MTQPPDVWFGEPFPLGVTHDGAGVNVAIYAEHADAVELCLFGDGGSHGVGIGATGAPLVTLTAQSAGWQFIELASG